MGAFRDRIRGFFNIGAGRVKQGYSHDTDDASMNMKGGGQEMLGKGQKTMGEMKDSVAHALHRGGSKVRKSGS